MPETSDDVLDRIRVREVTGVFHSRKSLNAAAQELLVAGVDRGDIDVSASLDELKRRSNYASIPPADLADLSTAARQPLLGDDDVANAGAVVGGVAGSVVAVFLAFYLPMQNIEPLAVAIIALLIGSVGGAFVILLVRRRLWRERTLGLEHLSEAHGLLIWVKVRSPEKQDEAQEILIRRGAEAVHVHEIEIEKRAEDLPLHSLRPDPWLSDEQLDQP